MTVQSMSARSGQSNLNPNQSQELQLYVPPPRFQEYLTRFPLTELTQDSSIGYYFLTVDDEWKQQRIALMSFRVFDPTEQNINLRKVRMHPDTEL